MEDRLTKSWNAFPAHIARRYLKSFGSPSLDSKRLVFEVLCVIRKKWLAKGADLRLLDVGCGNANLAEYLASEGLSFSYVGVDFSGVLLAAAAEAFPAGVYLHDDVNELTKATGTYDVVCYSHVLEMLSSPEASLLAASARSRFIVIRFFEPPADRPDCVELLDMNIGTGVGVPYLRRKMSMDYYQMILHKIGCKKVDVYKSTSKDQVHVIHMY